MTQEQKRLQEKRQEILQRLRNRRGEARRFDLSQGKSNLWQDDPLIQKFLHLRDLQADIIRGADVSEQLSELGEEDKLLQSLAESRLKRYEKRTGKQLENELEQDEPKISKLGEDDQLLKTFLELRKATRQKRQKISKRTNNFPASDLGLENTVLAPGKNELSVKRISSTDFIRNLQQLFGVAEAELNSMPLEELEQRRKDLQYRYDWMRSVLDEMRSELDRLNEHIISQLQALSQGKQDSGQDGLL